MSVFITMTMIAARVAISPKTSASIQLADIGFANIVRMRDMPRIMALALLILFQAVPPVPPKTIGNPGDSTKDINNDSKTNNAISPAKTIENPVPPINTREKRNNAASEEKPRHIVIDLLPGKDVWDKVYICLTAALVVIGGFTFIAIWIQAKETAKSAKAASDSVEAINRQTAHIARQAKSMRRQTTILRNNVNALIASERAWIMVDIAPAPGWGGKVHGTIGDHVAKGIHTQTTSFALRVISRNEGKAPAWIIEKRICVDIRNASLPTIPDLDSIQTRDYEPQPVAVGKEGIPAWDITPSCDGHEDVGRTTVIYGAIIYRDPFSESHITTFGYSIAPDGQLKRLEGLPKYNENT
jgi:hypothetical protein